MKLARSGSVMIIILAALALAAAGGLAYYALRPKPVASTSVTPLASVSKTPEAAKDPYEGWKSYTTKYEQLSFRYPADWVIRDSSTPAGEPYDWMLDSDNIQLTAKSGLKFNITSGITGLGGACTSECQASLLPQQNLAVINIISEPLYVLTSGFKPNSPASKEGSISLVLSPSQSCELCDGYEGKVSKGIVIINAGYSSWMEPQAFVADADVQQSILVYKSLKYSN